MSKLAHSNQETMDEIDHQLSDDGDYRHRDNGPTENSRETPPFITALKTGGTKEEAIFALERQWEENCELRAKIKKLLRPLSVVCCYCDHAMACENCGREQPNDTI